MQAGMKCKWETFMRGEPTTKAGVVFAVVPPRVDPRSLIPAGYFFASNSEFRTETSYLVRIPKIKAVYWPENPIPLNRSEEHLIYSQKMPESLNCNVAPLDTSDRCKLKKIFDLTGVRYVERTPFIADIDNGRRYWFETDKKDHVEYISEIEEFKVLTPSYRDS